MFISFYDFFIEHALSFSNFSVGGTVVSVPLRHRWEYTYFNEISSIVRLLAGLIWVFWAIHLIIHCFLHTFYYLQLHVGLKH